MSSDLEVRKTKVLVVEDNPGDVELLRWALRRANLDCDLTVIDDGAEAMALVRQRGKYATVTAPDIAILDLNLPKYDGLTILSAMRANIAFAKVPVAVLSASSSPRDRERVEEFHIACFITKPPDLDEFLRIGVMVKELLVENAARIASGKS
jgi:chemotaxis family two-component system response regulator Rcp1